MDSNGFKMLVVDDEGDICFWTKSYFERRKFKVFTAYNAKQALEIAKRENPQVILLDFWLGDINGIELLLMMRNDGISSKVIMFTSNIIDHNMQQILKGADIFGYLQKPILLRELDRTVKLCLGIN